eukprot:gene8293-11243_t
MQFPGGNAVNVAVFAARLGARAGYLGCLGDDAAGRLVRESLAAEGVDTSHCRIRPGANARAMIGHVDGERRFLSASPGVRADYRLEDADRAWIGGWDHVHSSINSDLDALLPAGALRRRSSSDRRGSPSKSMMKISSLTISIWPRWKSP